jgi:hypothetical protein
LLNVWCVFYRKTRLFRTRKIAKYGITGGISQADAELKMDLGTISVGLVARINSFCNIGIQRQAVENRAK